MAAPSFSDPSRRRRPKRSDSSSSSLSCLSVKDSAARTEGRGTRVPSPLSLDQASSRLENDVSADGEASEARASRKAEATSWSASSANGSTSPSCTRSAPGRPPDGDGTKSEDEEDDAEEDEEGGVDDGDGIEEDAEEHLSREEFDEQVLAPEGIRPMSQRGIDMWEEYNNQF